MEPGSKTSEYRDWTINGSQTRYSNSSHDDDDNESIDVKRAATRDLVSAFMLQVDPGLNCRGGELGAVQPQLL